MSALRPSVAAAITAARARGVARLDAELMLARLTLMSRTALIAHDDALLADAAAAQWSDWLERRAGGEPLAYLLGEKEFHGLMLEVSPDVLIPRPETELLVEWADQLLRADAQKTDIVDLGTGSGAIALAVKSAHPQARVTAIDSSGAALAVARRNGGRLTLAVEFIEGAWWQGLQDRRFDIALANPPYVGADDVALDALRHEPRSALTPGGDGLGAIAAIVAGAPGHLRPGGWLVVEHGFAQARPVRALLRNAGLEEVETRHDLAGHERASGGRRVR